MINRDDIEAGDKVYTRDGGCLVAYDGGGAVWLGLARLSMLWREDGICEASKHLDIIRIDKAPKPVVEEVTLGEYIAGGWTILKENNDVSVWPRAIKLTIIINGKLDKAEQVK
jgi:hypothetical protein